MCKLGLFRRRIQKQPFVWSPKEPTDESMDVLMDVLMDVWDGQQKNQRLEDHGRAIHSWNRVPRGLFPCLCNPHSAGYRIRKAALSIRLRGASSAASNEQLAADAAAVLFLQICGPSTFFVSWCGSACSCVPIGRLGWLQSVGMEEILVWKVKKCIFIVLNYISLLFSFKFLTKASYLDMCTFVAIPVSVYDS